MPANDNIQKINDCTFAFTCKDCGRHITNLGPEPQEPICAFCSWINEFVPDPKEQTALRKIYDLEKKDGKPV